MGVKTICCVAQLEQFDPQHDYAGCEKCGGLKEITHTVDGFGIGYFKADVIYGGGGLEGYQIDDRPFVDLGPEFPEATFRIDYPEDDDWEHMCVQYNREGNPRVNIVAMDDETKKKFRPADLPADGTHPLSPIESVTYKSYLMSKPEPYGLQGFPWEENQQGDAYEKGAARGAFSAQPAPLPATMLITAKAIIKSDTEKKTYAFVRWERNRLSKWVAGTPHQWIENNRTIEFDPNTFEGLIAYYVRKEIAVNWNPPQTLPQPREDGYPIPKVLRLILNFFGKLIGLKANR